MKLKMQGIQIHRLFQKSVTVIRCCLLDALRFRAPVIRRKKEMPV